ncbi:MAG: Crp/Fnr family transcriptional regulator [Flavobacteriales bacterium]|nr:Crp/Fnr family transcriptional regulator [Flavobacteriales bacterium]MCB9192136.1 Crp/Fnr family transcriptional regulator [Flavobacteriales bacterium]MCB9203819.1 Crp/Fnr family transcriptional regulator [Flavobacteriales bacterium]
MVNNIEQILDKNFPSLLDTELIEGLKQNAEYRQVAEGDLLMDIGSVIKFIPMIISGSVKVMREDEDGNELLLYYVSPGETCAMSLTCCMAFKRSEIRAIAQEPVEMLAVPVDFMDEWMKYRDWRSYVMNTYRMRFEELLEALDSIAFHKIDERVLKYLEEKANSLNTEEIQMSHQEIAVDLNSSREVISRILKQMERKKLLKLGRNKILLLNR